jgi:hypothetical protein
MSAIQPRYGPIPLFRRLWTLLLPVCLVIPLVAQQSGPFRYTSDGNAVTITRYTGAGGEVEIPSTIADLPVRTIGFQAFYDRPGLTGVRIPDSVTTIGEYAFLACTGLTKVSIGNGVTSIKRGAFTNCWALENVTIPGSVTSLEREAFYNCRSLSNITIPSSITTIESETFIGCIGLESVDMGNGVASIGVSAFQNCTSLASVVIPDSVTALGESAFAYCRSLASVSLGKRVTVIGNYAFKECVSLTGVQIPGSVTSWGAGVFGNCRSLASATIDSGVTSIGDGAFSNCTSLVSLRIPDTVTSIGSGAFAICKSLTNVLIPDRVTSISAGLFTGCTGLNNVGIHDRVATIGDGAFRACTGLTGLTLPNSLTSIGEGAFWECAGLMGIALPSSVTSIGRWAFRDCRRLSGIQVATANTSYRSVDGVLFDIGVTTLIQYPCGRRGDYVIPGGVTTVGGAAFERCAWLTGVTIPASITTIESAFQYCSNLNSATFEGNAPDSFDGNAFFSCGPLFTVYYHEGMSGFSSPTWNHYNSVALGAPGKTGMDDWRKQHFGEAATNSGDAANDADPDGDGWTNWDEFAADSEPKNPASFFRLGSVNKNSFSFTVTFDALPGRRYVLMRLDAEERWEPVARFEESLTAPGSITLSDTNQPDHLAVYKVYILVP